MHLMKSAVAAMAAGLLAMASSASAQTTIFSETMGNSGGTVTLAAHITANGFDNSGTLTYGDGGAATPVDVRTSLTSAGTYTGASGASNLFFGTAGGDLQKGFSIGGINTTGFENLVLSFGANNFTTTANVAVEWSTDGLVWNALSYTPQAGASWGLIDGISLPVGAEGQTNLQLRWVKPALTAAQVRIDDVLLAGDPAGADFTIAPSAINFGLVDAVDGPFSQDVTLTSSILTDVNVTLVSATGSSEITLATASPSVLSGNGTLDLSFVFTPLANDASSASTTFSFSTDGNPATFDITVQGQTVLDSTIADFRADAESSAPGWNSTVYKVTGVVTSNNLNAGRNHVTIQDRTDGDAATRGLTVDDNNGTGLGLGALPEIGETLVVYGTGTQFRGLIQFVPQLPYVNNGGSVAITPVLLTSTSLSDANESVLVVVNDATVVADTYTAAITIPATDSAGAFDVRLQASTALGFTANLGDTFNFVGVLGQFDISNPQSGGTGYQVQPRLADDVELVTPSNVSDWYILY